MDCEWWWWWFWWFCRHAPFFEHSILIRSNVSRLATGWCLILCGLSLTVWCPTSGGLRLLDGSAWVAAEARALCRPRRTSLRIHSLFFCVVFWVLVREVLHSVRCGFLFVLIYIWNHIQRCGICERSPSCVGIYIRVHHRFWCYIFFFLVSEIDIFTVVNSALVIGVIKS